MLMILHTVQRFPHWVSAGVISALAAALYLPFLGNPLTFDDLGLFSGSGFAHYASAPLGALRSLPYFSLAFTQIMWGQFPPWSHAEVHRIGNLLLHIACALALYKLLYDLLRGVALASTTDAMLVTAAQAKASVLAGMGAVIFVFHPVAVYGVAYLIERTIILATLFSLLSLIFYARGLRNGNRTDALTAALFYTLAIFSKEHSVLLPLAALMLTPLLATEVRFARRYAGLYALTCLPVAITVVILMRAVVGTTYEPYFAMLLAEQSGIPEHDFPGGLWLVSAITQSGLFFSYLTAWLLPDTAAMSIDLRVDFMHTWSLGWIVLKLVAFGAFGVLSLMLLFRRGKTGLVGFGLLYFCIVFLVEFSAVRFQEPFVLYRSYLWGPGLVIALVAVMSAFPRRLPWAIFLLVCPLLIYQAHDRLQTFSSNLTLWADAAEKLPAVTVPWGWRPLFNLAREQTHARQAGQAIETVNRCLSRYPESSRCFFARGAIHNYFREYEKALPSLERSLAIYPDFSVAHYHRAVALENLGRLEEAKSEYRESLRLGYFGANQQQREPE